MLHCPKGRCKFRRLRHSSSIRPVPVPGPKIAGKTLQGLFVSQVATAGTANTSTRSSCAWMPIRTPGYEEKHTAGTLACTIQ